MDFSHRWDESEAAAMPAVSPASSFTLHRKCRRCGLRPADSPRLLSPFGRRCRGNRPRTASISLAEFCSTRPPGTDPCTQTPARCSDSRLVLSSSSRHPFLTASPPLATQSQLSLAIGSTCLIGVTLFELAGDWR